jgi:hypothetical protein
LKLIPEGRGAGDPRKIPWVGAPANYKNIYRRLVNGYAFYSRRFHMAVRPRGKLALDNWEQYDLLDFSCTQAGSFIVN